MSRPGGDPPPAGAFFLSHWLILALAACLAVDLAVLAVCPAFGGDCLYGFLTLIAFPVVLSGPLGVTMPRLAARAARRSRAGWRAGLGFWVAGFAALMALILLGHVIAVRFLNGFDYGGVLVRPRLLQIGLGLAAVYYVALGAIALRHRDPD